MEFVDEHAGDERINIQLKNAYGGEMSLRYDDTQDSGEWLVLSEAIRSELSSFSERWHSAITHKRFTKRFDRETRQLGEKLRRRLQTELGDRFHVTYVH